ncbi:MAG TPA: fatty acid desaturase, partial [Candidatus Didemnitutus sp.]|nr:fatty acid desaturase [Candidatus Didemnitutus sp.]
PLFFWVGTHRYHHQHSDSPEDPHSPHVHGSGLRGILKGCWHAHIGWMLAPTHKLHLRTAADLMRDRQAVWINRHYLLWMLLGVLLPAGVGGLWAGNLTGAATAALWGGPIRIFLVQHATWSINSLCHLAGYTNFETPDRSTNHPLCALLTLGEGWHNNHHAFPSSARHGLRWWEFDFAFLTIRFLALVGLADNIRLARLPANNRATSPGEIRSP